MDPNKTTSIYGYQKNPSMVDYPDRLSALFFTSGCNFRCGFCHNAPLMGKMRPGLSWNVLEQACARFRVDWVTAVSLSGGEPTMAPDLEDILRFFKEQGFGVKLDSNGSHPEVLEAVLPWVDFIAMDVKCALSSYEDLVCHADTRAIERSIDLLLNSGIPYEFRTTVLPHYHTDEQMEAIGRRIQGAKRFVVQPFVPRDNLAASEYCAQPRTPSHRLREVGRLMDGYVEQVVVRGAGKDQSAA